MCGMKRHRILHLLTTFALGAIFIATHILSVFYVLYLHCRSQHISWHDIPYRCVSLSFLYAPVMHFFACMRRVLQAAGKLQTTAKTTLCPRILHKGAFYPIASPALLKSSLVAVPTIIGAPRGYWTCIKNLKCDCGLPARRIPAKYLAAGGALVICNTAWLVSLYKDLPPRRGSAKSA